MKIGMPTPKSSKSPVKNPHKHIIHLEDITNYESQFQPFSYSPCSKANAKNKTPVKREDKKNLTHKISERIQQYKSKGAKGVYQQDLWKLKT